MARILLISNGKPADCVDVTDFLAREGHEWQLTDTSSATAVTRSWHPHVVILDVTSPDTDMNALIASARADESSNERPPLIVLAPDLSLSQRLAVLQAGANECLIKPIHPTEFGKCLGKLLAQVDVKDEGMPGLGHIVAVYGAKGGVGATTVAINTAFALQQLTNGAVCLFDANFQFGDHRIFLDLAMNRAGIEDIIGAGISDESLAQNLIRHQSKVDLLLSPRTPEYADLVTPEVVVAILEQLKSRFDYVVVDVERYLGDRALQILDLADVLCLVTTSDLAALKNMRLILGMLRDLGFDEACLRLLLNRSGASTGIDAGGIEKALGHKIDYRVVNDSQGELEAINSGRPTMVSRPASQLGVDFTRLAKTLLNPPARAGREQAAGLPVAAARDALARS